MRIRRISYADIPGFPVSAVSGHAGEVVAGRLGGVPVIMLSGRVHFYEKGDANAMRAPIEVLQGARRRNAYSHQFGRIAAR
jgi:purine-nucleoside phosphorylase